MLEQAQALDPASDLARKMLDQIKADPQKELGAVFFRYTVQRDDSLSKIAQPYMGDRYKFHILAKYNDIANPSRLAAGQVIKVPGKGPAAAAAAAAPAIPATPPAVRLPRTSPTRLPRRRPSRPRRRATRRWRSCSRDATCRRPATSRAPTTRSARRRCAILATATPRCSATRTRQALARRYEREATQAFQRQNLDEAIGKWDRVLALEPQQPEGQARA